MFFTKTVPAAIALAVFAAFASPALAQDSFYSSSDDIELIVPYGPGGGGSVFGLLIADQLPPHVAGDPGMHVINIEGGQSVRGANEWFTQRDADGYHLLMGSGTTHFPAIFGLPGVQYNLHDMVPILGAGGGAVFYASPSAGVNSIEDLLNPSEPLVYGGLAPIGIELARMLVLDLLEINVKNVVGYESRGASRIAFEQGETNINSDTSSAYITEVAGLVESGAAVPLFVMGQIDENGNLARDPLLPDLPHPGEVYEKLHGKAPSGPGWDAYKSLVASSLTVQRIIWAHKDIPGPALDALVAGATKMVDDPEFQKASEVTLGGYPVVLGAPLRGAVTAMSSPTQETIDYINNYLLENFGITLENSGN